MQTVTITESREVEIPDGYVYIDYRVPKLGELILYSGIAIENGDVGSIKYIILEKIPEGFEFVRYGRPKGGEQFFNLIDQLVSGYGDGELCYMRDYIIVKPKVPTGYEYVDYRVPVVGETFLHFHDGKITTAYNISYSTKCVIINQIIPKVPTGYTFVRHDYPKNGELYNHYGDILIACWDFSANKFDIVTENYKWPEFINTGTWMCKQSNGTWCLFSSKPTLRQRGTNYYWEPENDDMAEITDEILWYIDFRFPECSDWTKSLQQKP